MSSWAVCRKGHMHFGHRGAAGLLLVRGGRVLLQQRSAYVDQGGTWSIPGGAIRAQETPLEAALRETREECGIEEGAVTVLGTAVTRCGGWPYTTVIARLAGWQTLTSNWEGSLRWVRVDAVETLQLHPAFAKAWRRKLSERLSGAPS